eukprot:15457231-Alexandrium_andersonii.AAC.1
MHPPGASGTDFEGVGRGRAPLGRLMMIMLSVTVPSGQGAGQHLTSIGRTVGCTAGASQREDP